jgi:multidrug efflux pump subunit AcrA (membrane-fusion protein)
MKKAHLAYLFISLFLLAAVSGTLLYRRKGYEVVRPKRGEITEAVYGLGRVKSNHRFEVIIGVIATVKKLHVQEGDFVKKGASLIQFETSALFKAPFDGTVTLTAVRENETALPQSVILRLEDLNDRYLELSLEQQAALRVRKGQPAKVSFESLRGKILEGRVAALFPREDEFLAHVSVQGLEASVLPGMTADVAVEVGKIPEATLVPLKALNNGMLTLKRDGPRLQRLIAIFRALRFSCPRKVRACLPESASSGV